MSLFPKQRYNTPPPPTIDTQTIKSQGGLTFFICQYMLAECSKRVDPPWELDRTLQIFFIVLKKFNFFSGRGRPPRDKVWVFGAVDTGYQPARGYVQIVPDRSRRTLSAIMNARLTGPTIVHSDCWRGYLNLTQYVNQCILHETGNCDILFSC